MNTDIDIEPYDHIAAHTVERNDQIVIDHDYIEVTNIMDDPEAPLEGVRIIGHSVSTGDEVVYDLHFADMVGLWAL